MHSVYNCKKKKMHVYTLKDDFYTSVLLCFNWNGVISSIWFHKVNQKGVGWQTELLTI